MSATERLRALLTERGVEWWEDAFASEYRTVFDGKNDVRYCVYQLGFELFISSILPVTPEQAIAATLDSCNCSNSERISGTCQKVYLVETSDDLIESWHPIGVYLSSEAAGDCAKALRGEVDGIRQFARVVELKVVDDG